MNRILLYLLLFLTPIVSAQTPADIDLVVGSGYAGFTRVQAIAEQPDGKILVGGLQGTGIQGAPAEAILARFNADGSLDSSFAAITFSHIGNSTRAINDIIILSDGKILVGGIFVTLNGEDVSPLVRLNPDGSKDNGFLYSGGSVNSIALQSDGKIVIVGLFTLYVNEHIQRYVARLYQDGTVDHSFDFGFAGFAIGSGSMYKVAIQSDGKILVGGGFSAFNNQSQGKLIRFNTDGTKDDSFNIGSGAVGSTIVADIEVQPDGKIIVSGSFTDWNGQPFDRVCRLNVDGTLDTSLVLGVEGSFVSNLTLQADGKMLASGLLTVNGTAKRLVRLNNDGSHDSLFNAQPNNIPDCVFIQSSGKILIGGSITAVEGFSRSCMARLNQNGTLDHTFVSNSGLNDQVFTIALQPDAKTLIGGDFTSFDGISQNKLIRLDSAGNKDATLNLGTGFDHSVRKIAVQTDGKIVVGGDFTMFNGATENRLLRLHANGTNDVAFDTGTGFDGYVKTIIIQPDGKILVGGNFTQFNGQPQNYLIRLNSDGSKDLSFNIAAGFNNRVTSLALQTDGKVIVGGNFTTYNAITQNGLIRLNTDGTKDTTFLVGTGFLAFNSSDLVRDIEISPDGKIYVVSLNPAYNGNNVGRPLRLHPDGSVDASFTQGAIVTNSLSIDAIALQDDGKLIVGGTFTSINNSMFHPKRIMRVNTDGTLDTTFDKTPGQTEGFSDGFNEGGCHDIIIQPDNKIWVGGSFFNYRGVSSFSAIRLAGADILSVEDMDALSNDIIAYPNPVKDVLHFNSSFKTIVIADQTGKTLARLEHTNQVNFANYAEGLYWVIIEQENGISVTKKIVKK